MALFLIYISIGHDKYRILAQIKALLKCPNPKLVFKWINKFSHRSYNYECLTPQAQKLFTRFNVGVLDDTLNQMAWTTVEGEKAAFIAQKQLNTNSSYCERASKILMCIINAFLLYASLAMAYVAHCLKMSALVFPSAFTADPSSGTKSNFGHISRLSSEAASKPPHCFITAWIQFCAFYLWTW